MLVEAALFCSLPYIFCNPTPEQVKSERVVTAYTLSVDETDSTPCYGASGENLCEALKYGESICAANWVPMGTILQVEGYGACRVADKMAFKNRHKVDILMHTKQEAKEWGKRKKVISYYK